MKFYIQFKSEVNQITKLYYFNILLIIISGNKVIRLQIYFSLSLGPTTEWFVLIKQKRRRRLYLEPLAQIYLSLGRAFQSHVKSKQFVLNLDFGTTVEEEITCWLKCA